MSDSLQLHRLLPARFLYPWNSSGKNTGVGCHSLLHGIFLTQGLDAGLLHCRQILYHLSQQGSFIQCYISIISQESYKYKVLKDSIMKCKLIIKQ